MAYLGKGNDTDVITMVSGLIKWAVSTGSGGGGLGVTVGSGVSADYETVVAALASSETILSVIGDTTEPSNPQVSASGASISIFNNAEVDMGTNSFEWTQGANLNLTGNGRIKFAHSVDTTLFDFNGNAGKLAVNGIELRNESTAITTLTNGIAGRFDKCTVIGEAVLDGTRNAMADCDVSQNITAASGAVNTMFSNTHYGGSIVDNGSGTILADLLSY
jgi:hypothetical protein